MHNAFKIFALGVAALSTFASATPRRTCTVKSSGSSNTDDAPAILEAFQTCGQRGRVVLNDETYHINSVMSISWLDDVYIDIKGKLLVIVDHYPIPFLLH